MKIKGILTILLALEAVLSCGKENPETCGPVTGGTVTMVGRGARTRQGGSKDGMVIPGSVIPADYTIMASAYFVNETVPEKSGDYFVLEPFTWREDGTWSATPPVFWPFGGNLSFLCLATVPDSLDLRYCTEFSLGNVSRGAQVDVPDNSLLESELLFANASTLYAEDGIVSLTFEHSQTWLQFSLACEQDSLARIDSITVERALTGGKFNIENNAFIHGEWSFRGHYRRSVTVPGSKGIVLRASAATCGVLLPEQEECDMVIAYSQRSDRSTSWDDATKKTFTIERGPDMWWLGCRYVHEIGVSVRGIELKVSVRDWDYTGEEEIVIGS